METKNNLFIDWIYKKPYKFFPKIAHRIKFLKFIYNIKNLAPDFDMLWNIAEFCKLLQMVYFYKPDNSKDHIVYKVPQVRGQNSFIIVKNDYEIKFILREINKNITIEIRDRDNYKAVLSKISFNSGECSISNDTDVAIFENLNYLIMDNTIKLLKKYYNEKK